MHAVHIVAGLRVKDGGPAYSVPRLCRALAAAGAKVDLMSVAETTAEENSEGGYRERRFIWDHAQLPILRALRASSALARSLRREAASADVIHNHGLWLMPNVYAGREAARAQRPLVIAPRGMLSPAALAFSRFKKRGFWHLLQRSAAAGAACFHATSEQEYEEIRAFGLPHPVAIISNGVDVAEPALSKPVPGRRTLLSLGRIHPKKGLDNLLRAWAKVESEYPGWQLRIVGPSEDGHDRTLKALATELGLSRVSIEGPVYGAEKSFIYSAAQLFVLPTLNENFALTVAEALAAGVPVIATKGAPWQGLAEEGCGWWVDHGVESLTAALSQTLAMSQEHLDAMGEKGRAWMARDFSWDRVARDVLDLYGWLSQGSARPAFVRLN